MSFLSKLVQTVSYAVRGRTVVGQDVAGNVYYTVASGTEGIGFILC
jgi:hypothetical protein